MDLLLGFAESILRPGLAPPPEKSKATYGASCFRLLLGLFPHLSRSVLGDLVVHKVNFYVPTAFLRYYVQREKI